MFEDSGLLVVPMLLLEQSLISDPVREAGLPMEPDFLLVRDGAAGSVREPLPGVGPLRSGFGFSFSAEEWEECNQYYRTYLLTCRCRKKWPKGTSVSEKGTKTMTKQTDRISMVQSSVVNERVSLAKVNTHNPADECAMCEGLWQLQSIQYLSFF